MKSYLVTGAAGFIGSNFIKYMLAKHDDIRIVVLDLLTYAGYLGTIAKDIDNERCYFVKGDICDRALVDRLFSEYRFDVVVNFAAESHVDRSIENPQLFLQTNILGTQNLLDSARAAWVTGKDANGYPTWQKGARFHQVSTDEVYGSLGEEGFFTEETPLCPHSPYSASKTSADHIVCAYRDTYHMPVSITRCSNNYGPYQFPEKLIPLIINNILEGKKLPVYSYETAPEPAIAGDEGASAKVVRTYYNEGVYDYFIVLNDEAEFKDYSFTVSLIDDVNFRWGDYSRDYGSDPITLNYTVERNDNGQHFQYESSTLTDGKFTFDLYLNYAAYDESLLNTLSITMTDSYTDEYGYTTTTTEGVTMDCDAIETTVHDSDPDMFKISVSVPVTLPANGFSYYLCMEIKMQTAENYKDIELSTFATLQKI